MKREKIFFIIVDIILMGALILLDQFTKLLAVKHLMGKPSIPIIPGILELEYLENRGAAFGLLQNQKVLFLLIGTVFLIVVLYYLCRLSTDRRYRLVRFFMCLIAAGAAGNMIDRFRQEYVVDFIYVSCIDFPIFNVADMYVTVSAAAMILLLLFVYREDELSLKKGDREDELSLEKGDREDEQSLKKGDRDA